MNDVPETELEKTPERQDLLEKARMLLTALNTEGQFDEQLALLDPKTHRDAFERDRVASSTNPNESMHLQNEDYIDPFANNYVSSTYHTEDLHIATNLEHDEMRIQLDRLLVAIERLPSAPAFATVCQRFGVNPIKEDLPLTLSGSNHIVFNDCDNTPLVGIYKKHDMSIAFTMNDDGTVDVQCLSASHFPDETLQEAAQKMHDMVMQRIDMKVVQAEQVEELHRITTAFLSQIQQLQILRDKPYKIDWCDHGFERKFASVDEALHEFFGPVQEVEPAE